MTIGVSESDTSGSGSKLNMPSRVPSDIWFPESLEGDVLGVVIFGFSRWGAEIDEGGMGEESNYEGMVLVVSDVVVIVTKVSKTVGVSVTGSKMGVSVGGGSKIGLEIFG